MPHMPRVPPSLKGSSVALFYNSTTRKYYLSPMLLPDWEALREGIKNKCEGAAAPPLVEVNVLLEFGRDIIRQEIADAISKKENKLVTKDEIFYFPYAWIWVRTGLRSQINPQNKIPVRTIAETPPDAKKSIEARPSTDNGAAASACSPCGTLRRASLNFGEPRYHRQLLRSDQGNAGKLIFRRVFEFRQLRSVQKRVRGETQAGEQIVVSKSNSKGSGLNIGGHLGVSSGANENEARTKDTRTRTVSANLINDSAISSARTISIKKWVEFPGEDVTIDKIADELANFVLRNATPIQASIKRIDDNTWKLTSGSESRSLTNQEMKQVVESSSKLNIDFSEKATIGCSEKAEGGGNPYCGSVDKQFKGVDDNGIKWQQEGAQWVPTSMTLYAVSQDKVSETSTQSVVEVFAKDGGMLVASIQPVAVDVVPGSDVSLIIQKEVAALKAQINNTLPKLDFFSRVYRLDMMQWV